MPFKKIDPKMKFPEMEKEILKFWEENKIFEKTLENRKDAKPYSFYDGPPFATGTPHYGHIVASLMKDAVPRFWTMKGFYIERKWGWDCHGLPIENIAEKELGIKHKKEIEEMGVEKFNEFCRSKVLGYVEEWKKIIGRLGRWADMENSYKTMDLSFMESVWWVFKQLWDKGLIYEGYRSMLICPRCETTLSQSEVAEGYKDVKDLSATAKFELADEPGTFVLAWTTTPWTLIGNVALAVGESIDYVKFSIKNYPGISDGVYIFSENDLKNYEEEINSKKTAETEVEVLEKFKGKDLIGKKYKPLFDYYSDDENLKNRENGWKIYGADFVTTEEGTGVVHIAPAFGEDDLELGKKYELPFVQHVNFDGTIKTEAKDFVGLNVKPMEDVQSTDVEIIKYLAKNNLLFAKEKYEHSYPHCWRCETPLINYATSSWFVRVEKIKEKALEYAKNVSWTPKHLKDGRFGNWLEGARDWSISRQRYWASVMPIWKCECGEMKVFGSVKELEQKVDLGFFYIMRHGEAQNNVNRILSCKINDGMSLSEKGKEDIKKIAQNLKDKKIDLIISSDLDRTEQTAEIISKELGIEVIFDKRLRETNVGDFDGEKIDDVPDFKEKWDKGINMRFPNGDDWFSLGDRAEDFYRFIFDNYRNKNILIVSHGDLLTAIEAKISGNDYIKEIKEVHGNRYIEKSECRELKYKLTDIHKHIVDKITFKCEKCGGMMKRIPDVLDTWFDSGSMPYAQMHYPFENKEKFEKGFPAEFIAEGVDQTRCWFYYLHVISSAIKESEAFENVVANGIVLAEDGKKMAKRLKNYPDPMEMFEKHGADAVRFFLLGSPVMAAENLNFSEREVSEVVRGMMRMLWNSYSFFVLYANIDKFEMPKNYELKPKNLLDKWIVSELNMLMKNVNESMENYELNKAVRYFPKFIDDLSNWYIRRSRKRFWKSENDDDKNRAYETLYIVLVELSKLMAPFTPFIAEEIYRNLTGKESVHLADFPKADESLIDEELNIQMYNVRYAITAGLEIRASEKFKVRQPFSYLETNCDDLKIFEDIIKEELNIKEIRFVNKVDRKLVTRSLNIYSEPDETSATIDPTKMIGINIEITEVLKLEGQAREIIRHIQEMRKEAGYEVDNRIGVAYVGMSEVFEKFSSLISKEVLANSLSEGKIDSADLEKEFEIDEEKLMIQIKK
jgi:isoleucyl-tRNA synthetase